MKRVLSALVVALVLWAQPASATWALVAHAKSGNADGTGGPFKAPNASTVNCTGADLYTVAIGWYGGTPPSTVLADVTAGGYTMVTPQAAAGDASNKATWFYKVAPTVSAVEQWTVTVDAPSTAPQFTGVVAACWSGTAVSPTITPIGSGTTTSTPSAGSLGSAGDLVLTAVADYTATVSSIDSSFAITDQSNYTGSNNIGIAMAWPNLSGGVAGPVNPIWTLSASPSAAAVQAISITGTGGGGGGSSRPPCALRLLGVGCEVTP
jgi:hypothetical protein